jgi:hypothetical protein
MKSKFRYKFRYYVERRSFSTLSGCVFMALSILLRLVWCNVYPQSAAARGMALHVGLPVLSCALFILCLLFFGKTALWLSFFPALAGVIFFMLKAATFLWWHRLLCTLLYLLVALLYGCAAFSILPIKKLLIPLFGLPLIFHIFVEDLIINAPMPVESWLQEGSVLCIMAGLLCVSLAMRREDLSK